MKRSNEFDRRSFLQLTTAGAIGLAGSKFAFGSARSRDTAFPKTAQAFPLESIRLTPSPFLNAINANIRYLHRLEPDRLLHNFRLYAKLQPKGESYGGWEKDTIAGHSLGHYLTACALMYGQTGEAE